MISRITIIIYGILLINYSSFGQNLEITHQGNGTTLSIPIESIDSVKFQLIPPPAQKKIYQNNGNILSLSVNDIDSITYFLPNSSDLPVLSTNTASVLSSNSAFCGGNVTFEGTSSVLQRGVCWSTSPNPTIANNYTTDGIGLGTFNSSIYPLAPVTTYYLRAYATNSSGTSYGNQIIIITSSPNTSGSLSTITTNPINYTDGLTASCGGNITADGGLAVIARGVCWAIGATPTINNFFTIDGSGAGVFSSTLNNLLPNTSYFVRAYATNDAGTVYGTSYSFTTNPLPIVLTDSVSNVTTGSANITGTVQSSASSPVVSRGICWSSNPQPTINDNIIISGSGNGSFTKSIIGLINSTTYYVRAFATNGVGTSYGNVICFNTNSILTTNGQGVIYDGYNYPSIIYGNGQEWMAENLRTTVYSNGDPIPNVQNGTTWFNLSTGAWANYANNAQYENPYGKLYNGIAVNDSRNVCPVGWHVPTTNDFLNLVDYLGGTLVANAKLRSTGTQYWAAPNSFATNESLFSALPGGYIQGGTFPSASFNLGTQAYFWATGNSALRLINNYSFTSIDPAVVPFSFEQSNSGCSVRCLKN